MGVEGSDLRRLKGITVKKVKAVLPGVESKEEGGEGEGEAHRWNHPQSRHPPSLIPPGTRRNRLSTREGRFPVYKMRDQ